MLLSTFTHVSVDMCFHFSFILQHGIAGSYGNCMFNLFDKLLGFFPQSGYTSLHPHQQCSMVPICLPLCQLLLLSGFLILTILTGMKQCLIVVLIGISLRGNDVEPLLMWFWPSGKCLFRSFAHFLIEFFFFLLLSCNLRILLVVTYCTINQQPQVIGLFRVTHVQEFMKILTWEGLWYNLIVQINSMKAISGKYLTYLTKAA